MKNNPKITRIKLETDHEKDYIFFGIVCHEPDYKLSLALNRKMNISLKSGSHLTIPQDNDSGHSFSKFSDSPSSPDLIYDLLSNRNGKYYLIKKLKNIDYIFRIYDPDHLTNTVQLISLIREIDCVSAVFKLIPKEIKDKNMHYITS
ncbi:MAG TPA: IPExxxVDY family protein [Bacteroidales bacterium]|nr:IPExxxVDY family protein [Bacteroidales bacterium]